MNLIIIRSVRRSMQLYGISIEDVEAVIVKGQRLEDQGNRHRAVLRWSNRKFPDQPFLRVVWVIEEEGTVVISVHPRKKGD